MQTILEQVQLVSAQKDWTNTNYYLQQLLSENNIDLDTKDLNAILELGLTILANGDFQQRWDIAKILPKLGRIIIEPLINILEDNLQDTEQRWFAAKILGNFPQREVIITLVNVLITTPEEDLRQIAALTLANLDKQALSPLIELLSYPELRLIVIRTLSQIRRPQVIEPLLNVVKDEDVQIRTLAIETLGSFQDSRITPILMEALQDLASSVRKEAVIALGTRADLTNQWQLIEHLQPLLADISLEVCQQTAIALSKFPQPQATTALFNTLESPHTPIPLQLTLIQSLAWQENQLSLKYLEQSLKILPKTAATEIISVLGRIQNNQSLAAQILVDFFGSDYFPRESITIKQTLAHSLGQLKIPLAIPVLEQLVNDQDAGVKLHALNAIKKIKL